MIEWIGSNWLTLVLGVGAIIGTIWAARRYGTRRGKLLLAHSVTALMPSGGQDKLGFTYMGLPMPVPDLRLVTLRLKNVGPHDITSDHFVDGKPLVVNLNATFMGFLRTASTAGSSPTVGTFAIGTEDATIQLGPGHLPKKAEWTVELLVEGGASPSMGSLLVNTDVSEGESNSSKVLREAFLATAPWPVKFIFEIYRSLR